jgi:cytochrome P450
VLPPGPRAPPLAQIGWWIARPLHLLESCQRRYGDAFTLTAPRRRGRQERFVIVSDPALIRDVLAADSDVLPAGVGNAVMLEPMLGPHSLLTLDGEAHLRQRRLLLPAFHGERMAAYAETIRAICQDAIARWPRGRAFDVHSTMQAITLDVILTTVFGLSARDAERATLRALLVGFLEFASRPWLFFAGAFGFDPFRSTRLGTLKRAIDASLYAMIALRRRAVEPPGSDVLSMMLAARDDGGAAMTDPELRDELITLLLAGHETTATSLAWAIDQLLAQPDVLARVRAECRAGGSEYLDAAIRETLRVRPILPLIGRHVAKPFTLGRWTIPVGTRIAPSIYLAGRRADAYPEPAAFRPERWLGKKPDPYTWLPFGGGIRRCIGMAFAQLEMRIVLETIVLQRPELRLVGGPARVVRRGITLAPARGRMVALA